MFRLVVRGGAALAVTVVALATALASSPGQALYELTIAPMPTKRDSGITTVGLVSGEHRKLGGFRGVRQQRWSEDGKRVVYRGDHGIWIANADGTGSHVLVSDTQVAEQQRGFGAYEPDWSADERTILFECSGLTKAVICSIPVRGGRVRRVAVNTQPQGSRFQDFDVSRRSGEIVATRITGDDISSDLRWDIVTIHADGSGFRTLTKRVTNSRADAVWSPDGSKIVFQEGRLLRMMNADGSDKHIVFDFERWGRAPWLLSWSPAGDLIGFQSGPAVWVIDPAGDDLRLVTTSRRLGGLDWRRH
jgi:Tol biopolymer transport system component